MSIDSTITAASIPDELRDSWRYLMGAGLVLAILGLLAILSPFVTGIAVSYLFGGLLVVGGLVHVGHAITARGWTGSLWQSVLAVVYLVAGVTLLVNPVVGLVTLTILLIAYLVVDGIVEIAFGLQMRSDPRGGWIVASGLVSLLLAGLLWTGFPSTALWAVGLLLGISLLTSGLSMVGLANTGRKATVPGEPGGITA